jgi:hypothetical protein
MKYICKYVKNGSDMAVFGLRNEYKADEITPYQMGRYVSSNEAVWRILDFTIHDRHPTVVHLNIYLKNGRVYLTAENCQKERRSRRIHRQNSFSYVNKMVSLKHCCTQRSPSTIPGILLEDFCRRKQGARDPSYDDLRAIDALGRVYTVHPNNAWLLHAVRGPTSLKSLKIVEGEERQTSKDAIHVQFWRTICFHRL